MAIKLSGVMEKFPPAYRAKIEARAQELIAENMKLQDMRKSISPNSCFNSRRTSDRTFSSTASDIPACLQMLLHYGKLYL